MKKRLLFVFIVLVFVIATIPAYAIGFEEDDPDDEIITFDDGSYAIIETHIEDISSKSNTKTASKSYKFYNTSDVLQWKFKVTGTFTYDGNSATATAVSTSHTIYVNAWTFDHATKSKSGNTVTGTGYFVNSGNTKSGTVTIKCSKTGVIS